jgi:hypothetical protein
MFRSRLDQIINLKHELVTLAVSWSFIETKFGAVYSDGPGMPPLPTRLMAGLAIGSAEAGSKTSKSSSYNRSVAVGVGIGPFGSGGGLGYSVSKSDVESVGKSKGGSADSGGSYIAVGIGYHSGPTRLEVA